MDSEFKVQRVNHTDVNIHQSLSGRSGAGVWSHDLTPAALSLQTSLLGTAPSGELAPGGQNPPGSLSPEYKGN